MRSYIDWYKRKKTVIMKAIPKVRAICLNRLLLIMIFRIYGDGEDKSSEVISNIIAITASHRDKSYIVRGNFIFYTSTILKITSTTSVTGFIIDS